MMKEFLTKQKRHPEFISGSHEMLKQVQHDRIHKAFTLAETMIVLIVLGVIAAITIPALVRKQMDNANRTKIKKAMHVYETALSKMAIMNNVKDNNSLTTTFAPLNDCTNTASYFKTVKNIDNNICKFKTSDGVWWDISDITHTIIAFDKDNLDASKAEDSSDNRAFYLVGRFDDNGILRVDDLKYETTEENTTEQGYLEKLYAFANSKTSSGSGSTGGGNTSGGNTSGGNTSGGNTSGVYTSISHPAQEMYNAFINGDFDKPCVNPDKRLTCTNCNSCYIMANSEIAYYDSNGALLFLERPDRNDIAINVPAYSAVYGNALRDYHYGVYDHTGNYDKSFPSNFELGEGWCYTCERDWITKPYSSFNRSNRPTYNYSNAISGLSN